MGDTMSPAATAEILVARLRESAAVKLAAAGQDAVISAAVEAAEMLVGSLRSGGKLLFLGNGGSSMDAGHLAAELVGRFYLERDALAAVSLADSTAAMTAIGNDYGYSEVFARQIEALGRAGDVVVALSTSGNSLNVVRALEVSRALELRTVAITGTPGGLVAECADVAIRVPSTDTPRIQECSVAIGHTLCELVERALA
jgi:D-sedoheptulose 7-phosphate isomerase